MNRKFRVWNKKSKEWENPYYFAMTLQSKKGNPKLLKSSGIFIGYPESHYNDKDFEIQQATGVKDIDDIDIYEGDLVEFVFAIQTNAETGEKQGPKGSFGVYEVFYKGRSGAFYLKVHKKNWFDPFFHTEEECKKNTIDPNCPPITITEQPLLKFGVCRVIGNIFENQDLLK